MWKAEEINNSSSSASFKSDNWTKGASSTKSTWESAAADVVNSGWPTVAAAAASSSVIASKLSDEWAPLSQQNNNAESNGRGGSNTVWQSQNRCTDSAPVKPAASSWSEVARKNVPISSSTSSNNQASSATAFNNSNNKMSVVRRGSDWGKPVDQGTPWDIGGDGKAMKALNISNNDPSAIHIASAAAGGGSSWSNRNSEQAWQSSTHTATNANNRGKNVIDDAVYWKMPYDKDQWTPPTNTPAPSVAIGMRTPVSWDDQPQSSNVGRSSGWRTAETLTNVWTGPPIQPDNSMVWNNPYPKKSTTMDKGTGIWGDPDVQGEIRRWKTNVDDSTPIAFHQSSLYGAPVQSTGASGGATNSASISSVQKVTPPQSSVGGSVWNDSPMAPRMNRPVSGSFSGTTSTWPSSGGHMAATSPFSMGNLINTLENSAGCAWTNEGDTGTGGTNQPSAVPSATWSDTAGHSASKTSSRRDSDNRLSVDSDAMPSEDVFTGHSAFGKAVLANQVAEQLTAAVKTGLIESHVLSQPLPPDTLYKLNQLLLCNTKLEQAQNELTHLHSLSQKGPLNNTQQYEYQRITGEISQLREKTLSLRSQINDQTASSTSIRKPRSAMNSANSSSSYMSTTAVSNDLAAAVTSSSLANVTQQQSSSTGSLLNGSKLSQWKHSDRVTTEKAQNGDAVSNEKRIIGFELSSTSTATDPWSTAPRLTLQGVYDWPPPCPPSSQENVGKIEQNAQNACGDDGGKSAGNNGGGSIIGSQNASSSTMAIDDGPPEFRPGQKWEWRDPRVMAEDPNATPGSIKTSAISLTRLSVDSKLNAASVMSQNAMEMNGQGGIIGQSNRMVYPTSTAFSASMPTTKSSYDAKYAQISSINSTVFNDGWSVKNVRCPPVAPSGGGSMAYNMNRMPPQRVGSSSSSYANNSSQYVHMPSNGQQQWVVLTHGNLVEDQTLQFFVNRVGVPLTFVLPPGSGFAAVKFKDVPAEKAVMRLQQDCSAAGVGVHLAKDADVEKLIQSVTAQRQAMLQHNAPIGPHTMVWDMPPPGTWGPSGPHAYGPPPPPPGVNMPDHVALMSHGAGSAPIYGDTYYGGMDHHPAY